MDGRFQRGNGIVKTLFLSAPQWQDSGLSAELYAGAIALRNYCTDKFKIQAMDIEIDKTSKPEVENDILGYRLLKNQLAQIHQALSENSFDRVITIGGGCGIEAPIIAFLLQKHPDLHLFWLDAHGDLNSPESSVSKHFHGMSLRFLTERQTNDIFRTSKHVACRNVTLVGVRDLDEPEADYMKENKITLIETKDGCLDGMNERIHRGKDAYIHIDLDVIDPREYNNVKCPAQNGLKIKELEETIRVLMREMNVVGISVLENTEVDESELNRLHNVLELLIDT
jgi:arginase